MSVHFLSLDDATVDVMLPGMKVCDCPPDLGVVRCDAPLKVGDYIRLTDHPTTRLLLRVEIIGPEGDAIVSQHWIGHVRRIVHDYGIDAA